jgi:hypothetical protein
MGVAEKRRVVIWTFSNEFRGNVLLKIQCGGWLAINPTARLRDEKYCIPAGV